ncbi:MAG: hypothetical protein AAF357_08710, partial [Verrucomicrobiota bacterium]
MANLRFSYTFLTSIIVCFLFTEGRAQTVQSGLGDEAQAVIDAPAVPVPDQPAIPDTIAIPRFDDPAQPVSTPVIVAQPMVVEEVEAVAIPTELIGEEVPGDEDDEVEMAEDATVQEEVAEEDSTVKKMEGMTRGAVPLTASALRARSQPEPEAKLGADVMTRTEA